MTPTQYDFGRPYQIKLLALVCTVPTFLQAYRDVVRPNFFDGAELVDIARIALQYHDKYGKGPTYDATEEGILGLLEANKEKAALADLYEKALYEVKSASLLEEEDIVSRAVDFARRQAFCEAVMKSIEDVRSGNRESIANAIRRHEDVSRIGTNRLDLGIDYFEDTSTWDEDRSLNAIPTGLPLLDEYLCGGLAEGELGVIAAPPNRGKSTFLINFGVAAMRRGFDVIHYSLEMERAAVRSRYDGCLLGVVRKNTSKEEMQRRLDMVKETIGAKLWIKCWPMNTATSSMISGHFHALKADGQIHPGPGKKLIIVDSGYLMQPETHLTELRHVHRSLYQSLVKLAKVERCPVWTGIQGNRSAEEKEVVGIEDLAECFAVAADADVVLGICQGKDELDEGLARIHTAKVREGVRHKIVPVRVDYERCRMFQTDEIYRKKDNDDD